jgi:hypothetical protein
MIFDVMEANDKNEHDAADIVCGECSPSSPRCMHRPFAELACVASGPQEHKSWQLRKLIG